MGEVSADGEGAEIADSAGFRDVVDCPDQGAQTGSFDCGGAFFRVRASEEGDSGRSEVSGDGGDVFAPAFGEGPELGGGGETADGA